MGDKYNVHITYRNERLEPVADYLYSLDEYTQMLRNDQVRMISDMEDMVYEATGGKSKEDWDDDVWAKFERVKHKILDKANEIARLPSTLLVGGDTDGKSN